MADGAIIQLFQAMDVDGNGLVTKHEFVEFLREHKPKHGPWASVAKLQAHFNLNMKVEIDLEAFTAGFVEGDSPPTPHQFEFSFCYDYSHSLKRRIQEELDELGKSPVPNCFASPSEDSRGKTDLRCWSGSIAGPSESPYQGGVFLFQVTFPHNYPFKPPNVRFTTKIYHLNIDANGEVCSSILKDLWSPFYTITKVLRDVVSLLADPNLDEEPVYYISGQFKRDRAEYNQTAKEWTAKYATGGSVPQAGSR